MRVSVETQRRYDQAIAVRMAKSRRNYRIAVLTTMLLLFAVCAIALGKLVYG